MCGCEKHFSKSAPCTCTCDHDKDDLGNFLETPSPRSHEWPNPNFMVGTPHTLTVHSCHVEDGETEIDYDVDHTGCPVVARYKDDQGNDIMEPNCGVWWEISEGGGLLESLSSSGSKLEYLAPGNYQIQHWTQRYDSTPDRATEWDAGIRFCTLSGDLEEPRDG